MTHPDLKLPADCKWGPKSGDYWPILWRGEYLAQFGGVTMEVTPERDWQGELNYKLGRARLSRGSSYDAIREWLR